MSELDDAIARLDRAVARLEAAPRLNRPRRAAPELRAQARERAAEGERRPRARRGGRRRQHLPAIVTRVEAALDKIGQALEEDWRDGPGQSSRSTAATFPLSCEDGQEPRLRRLAQYIDSKVAEFVKVAWPGRRGAADAARRAGHRRRIVRRQRGAAAAARSRSAPTGRPARAGASATGIHGIAAAHRVHCGAARNVLATRCGWGCAAR